MLLTMKLLPTCFFLLALSRGTAASLGESCTPVKSWSSLKEVINVATRRGSSDTDIVVCPFRIEEKPSHDEILVKTSLRLSCNVPKKCVLKGSGKHFRVQGPQAQLSLSGFVLAGATESAVQISSSASKKSFRFGARPTLMVADLGLQTSQRLARFKLVVELLFCCLSYWLYLGV